MKKISAILVAFIMFFSVVIVPVSAESSAPEMSVKSTPNWGYDYELDDKYVFPDYFCVGTTDSINFSLGGIETLELCEFDVLYNSEVFDFVQVDPYVVIVPCIVGAVPDSVPVLKAEVVSDGKMHVVIKSDATIKKQYFFVNLAFKVKATGNCDIEVDNVILTDCDGKNYDVVVNTDRVPVRAVDRQNIPSVKLDFEQTLSYYYGSSNYVTTELSYPMTVSEFISTVQVSDEICEKIVVNDKGDRLGADEKIPTGARFVVLYEGLSVYVTNLVLIGDVNGDAQINAADARKVLRYTARIDMDSMDSAEIYAANTAKNNEGITAADARELLRFSAGIGQTYADFYEYHCVLRRFYPWLINDNLI